MRCDVLLLAVRCSYAILWVVLMQFLQFVQFMRFGKHPYVEQSERLQHQDQSRSVR